MADKYDQAIAAIKNQNLNIVSVWDLSGGQSAGNLIPQCLFQRIANPAVGAVNWHNFGCLTMVKSEELPVQTPELTEKIKNDPRIPVDPEKITVEDLEVLGRK